MTNHKKTKVKKLADFLTQYFGTLSFFTANAVFFAFWIIWNAGLIPALRPIDPYPFNFLTLVVSLEAIFLSVIVLISQNRAGKIAEIREKIDLAVNTRAENQITKIINMIDEIHDHLGLNPKDDAELKEMKKRIDLEKIEKRIEKE